MFDGRDAPPEREESLWILTVGPSIWALHFLACYVTGAIYCAKAGGDLATIRWVIGGYTVVALIAIGLTLWHGLQQHLTGVEEDVPHLEDSAGDRHRFLGFATALLCGLSAVATLYVAMVALFFDTCL